jgi:hypothetical protein
MADGGHGVLQGTPAPRMHVHIATGHRRDLQAGSQLQALLQMTPIVLAAVQVHRQPQALGEGRRSQSIEAWVSLSAAPTAPAGRAAVARSLRQQAITAFRRGAGPG